MATQNACVAAKNIFLEKNVPPSRHKRVPTQRRKRADPGNEVSCDRNFRPIRARVLLDAI